MVSNHNALPTSTLSTPVHFARWAHIHRFMSVRLSVCLDWTKPFSGKKEKNR